MNLTFDYDWGAPIAVRLGSVTIHDGFSTDELGRTTTYALIRPLAFFDPDDPYRTSQIDPGEYGLKRLSIDKGQVTILPPSTKNILLVGSPSHQFLDGRVKIVSTHELSGALKDFSVWGVNKVDPRNFYVESATDTDSGGVTEPFTRVSAVFVPHRKTRYMAVGARVQNMPSTGDNRSHYLKKWMLEKAPIGDTVPSKYGQAREVIVKVRPDRLNWSMNPGLQVNTSNWLGTTRVADAKSSTGYGGVQAVPAGSWSVFNHVIPVVRTGKVYTVSLEAEADTPTKVTVTLSGALGTRTLMLTPAGERIQVQFTATNSGPVTVNYRVDSTGPASTVRFREMLVEETEDWNHTFFDGSTSADCMWEEGATAGNGRSYLYKNRFERYAAIKRVLEENVPMGIGIAEPVFATLPAD